MPKLEIAIRTTKLHNLTKNQMVTAFETGFDSGHLPTHGKPSIAETLVSCFNPVTQRKFKVLVPTDAIKIAFGLMGDGDTDGSHHNHPFGALLHALDVVEVVQSMDWYRNAPYELKRLMTILALFHDYAKYLPNGKWIVGSGDKFFCNWFTPGVIAVAYLMDVLDEYYRIVPKEDVKFYLQALSSHSPGYDLFKISSTFSLFKNDVEPQFIDIISMIAQGDFHSVRRYFMLRTDKVADFSRCVVFTDTLKSVYRPSRTLVSKVVTLMADNDYQFDLNDLSQLDTESDDCLTYNFSSMEKK